MTVKLNRLILAMVLCAGIAGAAQQLGSFTLDSRGSTTVVTAQATGIFNYTMPTSSGTLALKSDIPTSLPSTEQRGTIVLINGTGSAVFTPAFPVTPNCVLSDPSGNSIKYNPTPTGLTASGVGPVLNWSCK